MSIRLRAYKCPENLEFKSVHEAPLGGCFITTNCKDRQGCAIEALHVYKANSYCLVAMYWNVILFVFI